MNSLLRQLPSEHEIFFDHVGWMIPDMDKASEAFLRLGFVLTPYSEHTNRHAETGEITFQGSANRLIMLETGYLELLTDVAAINTPVSHHLRSCLERYTGVHLAAFSVADAAGEAAKLTRAGFELQPTVNLRRIIEAADGSEVEVAFSVIRPQFGSIAEGRIQSLTHHTPQYMWQQRYVHHTNVITGLRGIVFCTDDPHSSAQCFAKYTDRSIQLSSFGYNINTDRGQLIFTDKNTLSKDFFGMLAPDTPSIPAIILTSSNIDVTRTFMKDRKIRLLADQRDRLVVHPDEAMGTALIIELQ